MRLSVEILQLQNILFEY